MTLLQVANHAIYFLLFYLTAVPFVYIMYLTAGSSLPPLFSFYGCSIVKEKKAKYSRQLSWLSLLCWQRCAGLNTGLLSPTLFLPFIGFRNGQCFDVNRHCGRQHLSLEDSNHNEGEREEDTGWRCEWRRVRDTIIKHSNINHNITIVDKKNQPNVKGA